MVETQGIAFEWLIYSLLAIADAQDQCIDTGSQGERSGIW
jgi:hypothetical protein